MPKGLWVAVACAIACGKPGTSSQPACVPADCTALGATCGAVGDGCGNVLVCGACATGETCGGGGKANVCGRGPCVPATCGSLHAACGAAGDGCGGMLACGGCGDGEACGAGGTPNVCAPVPPTGDVRWATATSTPGPDFPVGAGSDSARNRYLLSFTWDEAGTSHTLRLQRLGLDGAVDWTREWTAKGFGPTAFKMAVTPAGGIYLAASADCAPWELPCTRSLDFGGGPATDSVLARFAPDGELDWQRELGGTDVLALAANEQEAAAVVRFPRGGGEPVHIEKYERHGTLLASLDGGAGRIALDPSGNLIAADAGSIRRFSGAGALQWSVDVPGAGLFAGLATTASGTVVALATRTGDVVLGPSRVTSGSQVVLVLEADGRPRFARGIAGFVGFLAVDPGGRAAVTANGTCGEIVVEAFDLSNADLWRRSLPDAARCWSGMWPGPTAFGADHRLFLTGTFMQTEDVGGQTFAPRGQDALGVLLDP